MQPKVKSYHSPDVDIHQWTPDDTSNVRFLLEMEIGPTAEAGADLFQVVVTTPAGLSDLGTSAPPEVLIGRALIVMNEFSWPTLRTWVEEVVGICSANSWTECTQKLQRFFLWEYEDYAPGEERPPAEASERTEPLDPRRERR